MKKKTLAAGLMAGLLAATQPQQEQMLAVSNAVKQIQTLTYNQAQTDEVLVEVLKARNELAMLNSLIAAHKFRVTDIQFISDFTTMQKSLNMAIALAREYGNQRNPSSLYRQSLREFSNEVFKFEMALNKVRLNHQAYRVSSLDGVEFTQQELDTLVENSTKAHL